MSYSTNDLFRFRFLPILLIALAISFAACSGGEDEAALTAEAAQPLPTVAPTAIPHTPTPLPPPTATPIPPTPTPPLAALVNGEPITLAKYQADLAQYTEAMGAIGESLPENYQNLRLMTLIEQAIIQQAADEWGIVISDEALNIALEDVTRRAEENGGYEAWLRANRYDAAEFPNILKQQLLSTAVIEEVVRAVPTTIEQARARYIVVNDAGVAQFVLDQARAGADFGDLAVTHSLDQATAPDGGDLGFIMRGWLFQPAVEDVIFTLQPNQISEIVTVDHGNGQISYFLVQLLEKDPARPLTSSQRDVMTRKVIEEWLSERLATAEIIQFEQE